MNNVANVLPLLILAPMLGACQPQASPPHGSAAMPSGQADACGATKLVRFVGRSDSGPERAAITSASGARSIRWLTPGMAVTMDYREDRLNANIGADNRYTGFNCG